MILNNSDEKTVEEKSDLEGGDYKCLGKSRSSMSCANKLEEKNARKKYFDKEKEKNCKNKIFQNL